MNRDKILIADDIASNREGLSKIFCEKYQILEAENGKMAVRLLKKYEDEIAVMLLEWLMPEMDGDGVLREMRENGWLKKIPVLVLTAEHSEELEEHCISMGAADLIRKPFDSEVIKKRVRNIVSLFQYKNHMEEKVAEKTEIVRKQYKIMKYQAEKLKAVNEKFGEIILSIIEYNEPEEHSGGYIVKEVSRLLAEKVRDMYPEYGLTDHDVEVISLQSSLRDIGKILIPDHVLFKQTKYTDEEAEYMKLHTLKGCKVLKLMEEVMPKDYQSTGMEICRYHHERYDGTGYPEGLKGDEIPISAQIVSVADAYFVLISENIYKHAYSKKDACYMILSGKCGMFSPKMMECFRMSWDEIEKIEEPV